MKQAAENIQLHCRGVKETAEALGRAGCFLCGGELAVSQDRLHNLSCSCESPGMSCAVGRALRAEQNSVLM